MKIGRFVFIMLLFPLLYNSCFIMPEEKYTDDSLLIQNIKISNAEQISNIEIKKCFDLLIRKGNFKTLEYFLDELMKNGIKYKNILESSIAEWNRFLNNLKNKFKFKEQEFQKVTPAIKWAQNKEFIFLEIKFSHRHDAPGCAEVEEEHFDIVNSDTIVFGAFCISGDIPIKFEVNLKLFDGLLKLRSHWGIKSGGKFQATLRKANSEWETLLSPSTEVPSNLQRWFEMEPKEDPEAEEEVDEDEEFEELMQQMKDKRKKKSRKIKDFNPIMK